MSATNPRDELLAALTGEWNRLGAELVLLAQSVADRLRINVTDLQCLAVVMSAGPITAGQIAEATGLTTGAITGVVDRLEKAGLVKREDDPADRRRVVVRALPGEMLAARDPEVSAAFASLQAAAAEQYEGYSDRELQLVIDALTRAHPLLLDQVSRLRQQTPAQHDLEAPLHGAKAGRLHLTSALGPLTIDADSGLTELYRAHVEGTPPHIEVDGGTVTVRPRRSPFFGWGHRELRLTLQAAIPWDIEVGQGAVRLNAKLAKLQVRSFSIKGGASKVDLALGRPLGAVPISIDGGASHVTVRRPSYTPIEVRIKRGASKVTVDGHDLGPAAGNMQWRSYGVEEGGDYYVVDIRGGASRVVVEPF